MIKYPMEMSTHKIQLYIHQIMFNNFKGKNLYIKNNYCYIMYLRIILYNFYQQLYKNQLQIL